MPSTGKSKNKPQKAAEDKFIRLKMITAFVVLTIIVGSFGIAVLVYTINTLGEPDVDTASSGYAGVTDTEEFIRRLNESSPELKAERLAYYEYSITAGESVGEATMKLDTDEHGFYVTVQYSCGRAMLDLSDYEGSVILDYLKEKQKEQTESILSDVSNSFVSIANAMSEGFVRDAEKYEFENCFYGVLRNGGKQYMIVAGLEIGIAHGGGDENVIDVKLCKYYEEQ